MAARTTRIGILGGGFGGLYTALRLNQMDWGMDGRPEIILIDQRDRFVFLPLLYELITDELQTWEIAPPYEELLANTGIQFCQATVMQIDVVENVVHLAEQPPQKFDSLVLALGGQTPIPDIPGVKEHALPFATIRDAYRLLARLRQLEQSERESIRVAIVGGGYSGVELACKLSDRLGERGRIRIIERDSDILKQSPEFNQKTAKAALSDRQVWLDLDTTVESIAADSLTLRHADQVDAIPVDLVLWVVGTQSSELIRALPVPQTEQGCMQTTPQLQVVDHPHLFALGTTATCAEQPDLPKTAQVAMQQADYCAWNLWATVCDRPLLPFKYQPLGEMLSLGTDQATLSGLGLELTGPLAHITRRLVYLYRLPTLEHQLAVGFNWLTRPVANVLSAWR
ncbi:MAG: NAD(P)/FAD-dependent oxidoreductase [Spirulina sp. SIO3F2]|nr:NAD(P)/FAD-dependent oxidoreductase [Spirulina sp. SIO3F2]